MHRNSKYHSAKVEIDGMVFDSKKEAKRYLELKALEEAGKITDLQRQVKFLLIPHQLEQPTEKYKSGKRKGQYKPPRVAEREITYVADFTYYDNNGELVVEDVKGMRLKDYIIKRKLMLFLKGIRIKEI